MEANRVWARWSGQGLCMELQAALETDAAFTSPTALQAWEETVVAQVSRHYGPSLESVCPVSCQVHKWTKLPCCT